MELFASETLIEDGYCRNCKQKVEIVKAFGLKDFPIDIYTVHCKKCRSLIGFYSLKKESESEISFPVITDEKVGKDNKLKWMDSY